jgi:hypothetical protein
MSGAKKRMGMVQLGLLGVAALLMGGALMVKEKREHDTATVMAMQSPAAGDEAVPPRAFGGQPIPGSATAVTGEAGAVEGAPGVSEGSPGAGISVEEAEKLGVPMTDDVAPPVMAEPDCSAFEGWVGKTVDVEAVKATGRAYRIVKPGDAMTMDFSPERINVETDEKGEIVVRVFCG